MVAALALAVLAPAQEQQTDSTQERASVFAKARSLKSIYKTDEAIAMLSSLEVAGTFDEELVSELADCYFQTGSYPKAAELYDSLSVCVPDNVVYKIRQMQTAFQMKAFRRSISAAHKVLQQDSIPAVLAYTGNAFRQMQESDSALWYYRRSLALRPDNEAVVSYAMNILIAQEKYEEAISMADVFLADHPGNNVVAPVKGVALYRNEDYTSAVEVFQQQEDLGNDIYPIHFYLGQSYWHLDNLDRAEQEMLCAWQIDSTDVDLAFSIASVKVESHLPFEEEVLPWLQKVEEMLMPDPIKMSRMHQQYGHCYYRKADWDKAIAHYKEAYRYNPKFKSALAAIGYSYQVKKDYKHAVEWFEKYLAVATPDTDNYNSIKEHLDNLKAEAFMEE